jgi:hypothetical protein
MQRTHHLLDYVATHPDAILSYTKSDMILGIHSDASYLSDPKAQSRAGGHFFLSTCTDEAPNNGAILHISQIIKFVMSSAAEAELGVLYINAREAVPCRTVLQEIGHPQPPTPIQTKNSTALGVVTNNILPRRTKAMDMHFGWLRDRDAQEQFRYYWRPGTTNLSDYWTSTIAAPTTKKNKARFSPHFSSYKPCAPPPTGAQPPPEKVSCCQHKSQQQQPNH